MYTYYRRIIILYISTITHTLYKHIMHVIIYTEHTAAAAVHTIFARHIIYSNLPPLSSRPENAANDKY